MHNSLVQASFYLCQSVYGFSQRLYKKKLQYNYCFLIGDININLDIDVSDYLNCLSENGFLSPINEPTRVTDRSRTILNHIFVKTQYQIWHKSIIYNSNFTNHHMTINFADIPSATPKTNCNRIIKRLDHRIFEIEWRRCNLETRL